MVLVDPYDCGKFGFWMYEQFSATEVLAESNTNKQHTPNLKNRVRMGFQIDFHS